MKRTRSNRAVLPCLAALILALLPGALGCAAPTASMQPLMPSLRVDPPAPGRNHVWIEFQDHTAQPGGFEDQVFDKLHDAVRARGYETVNFPEEADYVLWATLRIFDRVENETEFNETLAGLGGVAGAAAGASVAYALTDSPTAAWAGGVGGGTVLGLIVAKLTQVNTYLMVLDLQLSSRRDQKITYEQQLSSESSSSSSSGIAISSNGGLASTESGSLTSSSSNKATAVRESFFAELEQRLVATAKGTRMNEGEAREMMLPKLVDGLKSQMPRYRGE